jgi:histidine triad (HIT) family protein
MPAPNIFRDIRDKKIPVTILYEDDECLAFPDKFPKAPTHILFIPKTEVASILSLTEKTKHLPGMLILKAKEFARTHGIPGYKLTFHCGKEGGQEIEYLHVHLMAEKKI